MACRISTVQIEAYRLKTEIINVVLLSLTEQKKSVKACMCGCGCIYSFRHCYPECKVSPWLEGNTDTGLHMAVVAAVHEGHR